jgi:uncharacterized protein YwbE
MPILKQDKKAGKSTKGTRIDKRALTEAELDQVSGGDDNRGGNVV